MVQTIDKEIIDYIHLLNLEQKQTILNMLKSFTSSKPKRTSIDQYNEEIEQAEKDVKDGKWISHEDVKKNSTSW